MRAYGGLVFFDNRHDLRGYVDLKIAWSLDDVQQAEPAKEDILAELHIPASHAVHTEILRPDRQRVGGAGIAIGFASEAEDSLPEYWAVAANFDDDDSTNQFLPASHRALEPNQGERFITLQGMEL